MHLNDVTKNNSKSLKESNEIVVNALIIAKYFKKDDNTHFIYLKMKPSGFLFPSSALFVIHERVLSLRNVVLFKQDKETMFYMWLIKIWLSELHGSVSVR